MSEKLQRTAATTRARMLQRYGNELHHKHNKNHNSYRKHFRSHPTRPIIEQEREEIHGSTGLLREFKLRKIRKRLDKGQFH